MSKRAASNTALGAATCRLIEQFQPVGSRLVTDPIVKDLVGTTIRTLIRFAPVRSYTLRRTEAILEGLYGGQVCRCRFIDDVVQSALSGGTDQLVILGAGFDTRPYRLEVARKASVFELDLPQVQYEKRRRLVRRIGRLPANVSFIPTNFNSQNLQEVLKGTSLDPSRPAVYVWEGVTQYVSEVVVRKMLSLIGRSARGSTVLFTYVLRSIIEGRSDIPNAAKVMDAVAKNGSPWVFGLEKSEVPDFVKQFHMNVVEDVGNLDYQARYLKPMGRELAVSEAERTVHAKVD